MKAPDEESGYQHYAFATFLEPGFHQFIIYDPQTNRAFCKEFVIEYQHQQVLFPEMPNIIDGAALVEKLPPVYHKWKIDTL